MSGDLVRAMRQNNQVKLNLGDGAKGEAASASAQETEARATKACLERPAVAEPSMEAVVERENLKKALAQVKRNKGAPGIDGMTVDDQRDERIMRGEDERSGSLFSYVDLEAPVPKGHPLRMIRAIVKTPPGRSIGRCIRNRRALAGDDRSKRTSARFRVRSH